MGKTVFREFEQGCSAVPPGGHPFLGAFAVHEEFVAELRSSDTWGIWVNV